MHLAFNDKKKEKTKSIKDVNWTEVSPFRPITTDDWSCPELPGRFMWDQVSRKVRKHVQCRMMPRTGCFKFTTRFRGVLFPKEQLESPPDHPIFAPVFAPVLANFSSSSWGDGGPQQPPRRHRHLGRGSAVAAGPGALPRSCPGCLCRRLAHQQMVVSMGISWRLMELGIEVDLKKCGFSLI